MIIKTMFILMLFLNGNVIEYMGHYENEKGEWVEMGVKGCLQVKRTLSRNGWKDNADTNTRYACEKHEVMVEDNWEGREVVRKILD
tara:strand:- start:491 stop:748 length:258 start_codon:yes stop_codon:yes gene_type:complete